MNFDHIPPVQGIYKITNTDSHFFYIGSSRNVRTRLKEHFYRLRKQTHRNKHLQRVFNLCGDSIFSLELLENCSDINKDELLDVEQKYLDSIVDWRLCYNQTRSTKSFGTIHPEEVKRKQLKLQQTLGENNPFYGKKHTEESKLEMAKSTRKRGGRLYQDTSGSWQASIKTSKKSLYLGSYKTEEEARNVRTLAEQVYWDNNEALIPELEKAQSQTTQKQRELPVGVYKRKNYEKFEARIIVSKVVINLGNFNTVEEALQARKAAELLYL